MANLICLVNNQPILQRVEKFNDEWKNLNEINNVGVHNQPTDWRLIEFERAGEISTERKICGSIAVYLTKHFHKYKTNRIFLKKRFDIISLLFQFLIKNFLFFI